MEPQEPAIDVRDLLWRLRRYAWLIALPIVSCLCAALLYCRYATPLYTSQILVSVERNTSTSTTLDPMVGAFLDRTNPRDRVTVVDGKIHSSAFLSVLVNRLGMNRDPALVARAKQAEQRFKGMTAEEYAMRVSVTRLGRMIQVSPGRGSLVQIATIDTDPQAARQLAEMIGDVLVQESALSTLTRAEAQGEFTKDQITVYEERLKKAEEALRAFQESRLRKGFTVGVITDGNLNTARNLQRTTEDTMDQLRARIEAAKGDWRSTMGNATMVELKSQHLTDAVEKLGELEVNYALAQLRAGADAEELQARIGAARQNLFLDCEQLAQTVPGPYSAQARSALAGIALDRAVLHSLGDRSDRLAVEIDTYLKNVESEPRDAMEEQRLKQDVDASRGFLTSLRQEATSSQVSQALASSALGPRLDIVEHPLLPLSPFTPQRPKILAIAALLGPLIAAGLVFACERLASVLRTTEQAEAEYGHPVIGTVPRIDGWARPGSYLANHWAALAVLLVILVTGVIYAVDTSPQARRPPASQLGIQQ